MAGALASRRRFFAVGTHISRTFAATRYGGLTLSAANSSEGSISILQAAYPDIDRRGNVMNLVHTALGALHSLVAFL